MSSTETQNDSTTTAPVAPAISDNSRATGELQDPKRVAVWKNRGAKLAALVVAGEQAVRGAVKDLAEWDLSIRSMILTAKGIPTWNAQDNAQTYAVLIGNVLGDALTDLDNEAQGSIRARFRKSIERARPEYVVRWIAANDAAKLKAEEVTAIIRGGKELATVMGNPSAALKKELQRHYKLSGLTVPPTATAFVVKTSTDSPGPGSDEPSEVLADLVKGAAAVETGQIAASASGQVLTAVYRMLSGDTFQDLMTTTTVEVEDRAAAIDTVGNCQVLLAAILARLNEASDEATVAAFEGARFVPAS